MTAHAAIPFNHHIPVAPCCVCSRPVGAFVPVAWRVIIVPRVPPAPGGALRCVTAYVGDLETARLALEIIGERLFALATCYMVNEESATLEERAHRWPHANWLAHRILGFEHLKAITPVIGPRVAAWGTGAEYSFSLPYDLAIRALGTFRLRGSLHLAKPVTTIYSRNREALLIDRARCMEIAAAGRGA